MRDYWGEISGSFMNKKEKPVNFMSWDNIEIQYTFKNKQILNKEIDFIDYEREPPTAYLSGVWQLDNREGRGLRSASTKIERIEVMESHWQYDLAGPDYDVIEFTIPSSGLIDFFAYGNWFEGKINPRSVYMTYDFKTETWSVGNEIYSEDDEDVVEWEETE